MQVDERRQIWLFLLGALILALTLGAFFTPPDPLSQVIVATPLILLYELSIFIAGGVERKRKKELEKALA